MFTITKEWSFDSAHFLPRVPKGHKCGGMHGHTYRLVLHLESPTLVDGMVIEYGELSAIVKPLVDADSRTMTIFEKNMPCLDHCVLNEIKGLENPTTEILAHWIYCELALLIDKHCAKTDCRLAAVEVHESSTTSCTYRPPAESGLA